MQIGEDRLGLLRVGNTEQQSITVPESFLVIAWPKWSNEEAIEALVLVPEMPVDGLLQLLGLCSPSSDSSATPNSCAILPTVT